CRQHGVFVDWNLLFGFPGEVVEDYSDSLRTLALLSHLQPPSSVGGIRLDRFSPNFENPQALGFANLRPCHLFRYAYPFDARTLMDLVYYFDCDRAEPFDNQGYLGQLIQEVERWKQ